MHATERWDDHKCFSNAGSTDRVWPLQVRCDSAMDVAVSLRALQERVPESAGAPALRMLSGCTILVANEVWVPEHMALLFLLAFLRHHEMSLLAQDAVKARARAVQQQRAGFLEQLQSAQAWLRRAEDELTLAQGRVPPRRSGPSIN